MDEKQLVSMLQNEVEEAFELLVRHYGGKLLATARRYISDEESAKDCLQEAFVHIFEHIKGFEGRSSLSTWMHRIVINTALMKLRSNKRHPVDYVEDMSQNVDEEGICTASLNLDSFSVETYIDGMRLSAFIHREIATLSETYRNVLLLRDIEEYSTAETADLLGMSAENVKTTLHRARARLKLQLEQAIKKEKRANG